VEAYPWENFGRVHVDREIVTMTTFTDKGVSVFSRAYSLKDLSQSVVSVPRKDTPQETVGEWECYAPKPKITAVQSRFYAFMRVWYYFIAPVFQSIFFIILINRLINI